MRKSDLSELKKAEENAAAAKAKAAEIADKLTQKLGANIVALFGLEAAHEAVGLLKSVLKGEAKGDRVRVLGQRLEGGSPAAENDLSGAYTERANDEAST